MLRHTRLVMMVLVAVFIVAVPAAVAQTPVGDQYQPVPPGGDSAPTDDAGAVPSGQSGRAPTGEGAPAPVAVRKASPAAIDRLPFTGGQVALVALIGLGLLILGTGGVAASRRRGASAAA